MKAFILVEIPASQIQREFDFKTQVPSPRPSRRTPASARKQLRTLPVKEEPVTIKKKPLDMKPSKKPVQRPADTPANKPVDRAAKKSADELTDKPGLS